jgi:quinoprotein glucose dehydrogenase
MFVLLLPALLAAGVAQSAVAANPYSQSADWPVYGGQSADDRYSPLTQINRDTVQGLRVAWRFDESGRGESQTNPLIIHGTLFAYTPDLQVIALDAATGRLRWRFNSGIHGTGPQRGLAYWAGGPQPRLLASVMNYLYALDPASGQPIASFGDHGRIDLRKHLRDAYLQNYVSMTSPGIIYRNLIIVGFRTREAKPAPPADIRAYDVLSGALRWSFHTIPHPGEAGYETWPPNAWKSSGSANNWAGFALDQTRGIVYVPTGSAVTDFYGADRIGNDLYADTLLALDAASGRRLWSFQTTHHDVWDRDLPSPPSLVTVQRDGRSIDAVVQTSKQGYVFVFDRVSGAPLFPVREMPFPASSVPGEQLSATQPVPLLPAPFARQRLTENLLTDRTPAAHAWALQRFRGFRSEGQYVPLGLDRPTVVFPGFDGGAEWGGAAVDPGTAVMYVNANDVAWTGQLMVTPSALGLGAQLYQGQCSYCHGHDRRGSPPAFPSLVQAQTQLSDAQIAAFIQHGGGRMPPFPTLSGHALDALIQYVRTGRDVVAPEDRAAVRSMGGGGGPNALVPLASLNSGDRYTLTGFKKFLDPDGYPAVAPPWGTLSAIDLASGRYLWKIPLGQYPELAAQGLADTGSENYGGPLVTAGGLVFIGATLYDHKLRAFDSQTGRLIWETTLPYAGTATPATYMVDGRQYLVIATSNARNGAAPQGSAYVAYALP